MLMKHFKYTHKAHPSLWDSLHLFLLIKEAPSFPSSQPPPAYPLISCAFHLPLCLFPLSIFTALQIFFLRRAGYRKPDAQL